jgi:hypothetical protein
LLRNSSRMTRDEAKSSSPEKQDQTVLSLGLSTYHGFRILTPIDEAFTSTMRPDSRAAMGWGIMEFSPEAGSWFPFERANNVLRNPTPVKVARLGRDHFIIHIASVYLARIESNMILYGFKIR